MKAGTGASIDGTGEAAANLRLSAERATAVMNALVSAGISRSRLVAEGYRQRSINTRTPEHHASDPVICLRVTQK